jgi:hypothetical protein
MIEWDRKEAEVWRSRVGKVILEHQGEGEWRATMYDYGLGSSMDAWGTYDEVVARVEGWFGE